MVTCLKRPAWCSLLLGLLSTLTVTSHAVSTPTRPILVLATATNYGLYMGEVLKAEGFNEFQMESAVQSDRIYLENRFGLKPTSTRTHCGVWCGVNASGQTDFTGQMKLEENQGYGLDTSLAHYDANATLGNWLGGVGNFIGTGLLMKYSDANGRIMPWCRSLGASPRGWS